MGKRGGHPPRASGACMGRRRCQVSIRSSMQNTLQGCDARACLACTAAQLQHSVNRVPPRPRQRSAAAARLVPLADTIAHTPRFSGLRAPSSLSAADARLLAARSSELHSRAAQRRSPAGCAAHIAPGITSS